MTEKLLTIAEVAERLNCGKKSVRRWTKEGLLQAVRIGQQYVRIPESSVDRLIETLKKQGG